MVASEPPVELPPVSLVAVDEVVLEDLVAFATSQAGADEVTPRLLAAEPGWSPARVEWLRAFHRDRRSGLVGPAGEATWAVLLNGRVVGAVRLKRTADKGVLETGIWLGRDARRHGVGTASIGALLRQASDIGASTVRADTTASNVGAIGVLRRLGFSFTLGDDQSVSAQVRLDSSFPVTGCA